MPPRARALVVLGLIGVMLCGLAAFLALRPGPTPPPAEIAGDPLLVQGREVFLGRCVSCHGPEGVGNGPLAKTLPGPPVGNLTDSEWKHGDSPEAVLGVIRDGVKGSQMGAWGPYLAAKDIRAVAAYVFHLAGRPVPDRLRAGE